MNATGLKQLNMWTFAQSQDAAARDGRDITSFQQWMSSLVDSPVKISLLPATVRVFEKAHALVFGGNSYVLFASYDPAWCCWKMSPALPTKTLKKWAYYDKQQHSWLLLRCPKSAMMQNGKLYLLPMPERPTNAIAGFAWPTLTASDINARHAPAPDQIHVTQSGTLKLDTGNKSHIRLSQTVEFYEDKGEWYTLTANDGVKEGVIEQKRENGLSAQVQHHSDEESNRLNPDWCEQLMGYPVGWTDPQALRNEVNIETVMRHRWPAPPGPQHQHEAPRRTERKNYRKDRIKALGNGVVPQVVLPIALAMKHYLEREDE